MAGKRDRAGASAVKNDLLRAARLARGWSQDDVADRMATMAYELGWECKASNNYVSRYEAGMMPGPRYRWLLSCVFGLPAEQLGLDPCLEAPILICRLSLRIPESVHRQALVAARGAGLSVNDWWVRAAERSLVRAGRSGSG